jgi:hypothetical protein
MDDKPYRRFLAKLDITDTCWLWTGAVHDGYPYGAFWDGTRLTRAHRWAYEHLVGPIPADHYVLHTCDTPRCVRPEHLFTGTQADKIHDAMTKGRKTAPPVGVRSKHTYTRKALCKVGHDRWGINVIGGRFCLECHRLRERRRREQTRCSRTQSTP